MWTRKEDLTGKTFNHLKVIGFAGSDGRYGYWKCRCLLCGSVTTVRTGCLKSGKTKSCGCLNDIRRHEPVSHGHAHERLYWVWNGMKGRCGNQNHSEYSRYGGRGIRVCDEWANDYMAFRTWAYSHGYDENAPQGACTIDRIDVNGNYEPSNCRLVDMKVQSNNRRNSRRTTARLS